jgi:hypothetical protein
VEHVGDLAGAAHRLTSRVAGRFRDLGADLASAAETDGGEAAEAAPHPLDESEADNE